MTKRSLERPLYWEFHEDGGKMALRQGPWKLVALQVDGGQPKLELYNLKEDPSETKDLSQEQPERVERLYKQMHSMRTPSTAFPFKYERTAEARPR